MLFKLLLSFSTVVDRCKDAVNDKTGCKNVWCKLQYTQGKKMQKKNAAKKKKKKEQQTGENVQQTGKNME